MGSGKLEVTCPCCETKMQVDKKTGEVIWKKEKAKAMPSLSDMVKDHNAHQKEQGSIFKKRSEVEKDRNRLLEEKFKEAQKNVDKSVDIPLRDIDLD
ncbi:MAG TPA: 2-nitropropane dioxygenase [Nitrospinaceae bacterium]|jgi:predicted amidophosphoribosyltransferase|nr:2-nitropropane dioxygenase [Nitrospinaceae bacterium]HAK38397.1 2-nitropropane dioxygenase [Nitrospina sp.]MDP6478263.1 2-nitropropane dioxygenase [Nitrospinaceae bacterium]MDP6711745.1 2-nitropropane dioxygenase [Nitrospinaceae bacterium]MDP7058372.1 2-nitropropane dioxygenase [Nitrospinaceae bacterium]|tara:strand:+ start:4107 stop:4397 length:291 start_codon:yes stop_codon:yes gene_type:complete